MNIKKSLFAAVLALTSFSASAQEAKVENVFQPHWYVQVQGGGQYTLGELDFSDLLSPTAQVGVGYNFTPVFGARLNVNAWQSKAGSTINDNDYKWKWNYVSPNVDLTINLSNLFFGFNPDRVFNFGVFAGIGANIGFKNDEAEAARNTLLGAYPNISLDDQFLRYYWSGTKVRLNGQVGANADFRLSERVSLGLEFQANALSDKYNSKKAGNLDWYFNGLVGLKINLGKTHSKREVKGCDPEIIYKDRIVEKVVEKPVEKIVEKIVEVEKPVAAAEVEPLKEVIYYKIRISDDNDQETLNRVLNWCKKYPDHKISISGYADKGTGNPQINVGYAKARAEKIAKRLQQMGIAADRMTVESFGDKVQPFAENDKNRCVIIVGE